MNQQSQSKTTFALRISNAGGTFRCQATGGTFPRAAFDTTDTKRSQPPASSSAAQAAGSAQRTSRVMVRPNASANTFRIGVQTAMFRIAG